MLFLCLNGGEILATIEQSIAISDGVTGPLARMEQGAIAAANRFDQAANAANRVENSVQKIHSENIGAVGAATSVMTSQLSAADIVAAQTANSVGAIGDMAIWAKSGIIALGVTMMTAFGAISAVIALIGMAFQKISGTMRLSDELSQTTARLNLMNDGLQTTAQLQDMIFASAQRSRAEYQATASFVAKVGMMAKDAFSSNGEVIALAEQINKIFKISGTSAQEQASATLQLTQALASGVLRGEELNAVYEAAPMMIQNIADYLDKPMGAIRDMAAEGQITAEIVKNAMFAAADETNRKFESIPKTWSDVWNDFSNIAVRGLQPLFEQISTLANDEGTQVFFNSIATGIAYTGIAVAGLVNNLRWLGSVASEVLSSLSGVFEYIAGFAISALVVYGAGWAVVNMQAAISAIYHGMLTAAIVLQNAQLGIAYIRMWTLTAATAVWTLVTQGVTAALRMLNLTMLMNPIGIVVFFVGLIIAAFGAWAVKTHGLRNTIADAFEFIVDVCQTGVNAMIKSINGLLGVINTAATAMNNLFGTQFGQVEAIAEVDFQGFKNKWSGAIRNGTVMDNLFGAQEKPNPEDYLKDRAPAPLGEIADADKDTSKNTKGIKEAMEITDEDLKYLRDIAEQETINKYTTAEVKIEMGGVHNNVSNDMDLDGVVRYINDSIFDGMVAGAEAVHP